MLHWLQLHRTGKKTAADATLTRSPLMPIQQPPTSCEPETPEQELGRLRARMSELEAETTKLVTERETPRQAAKYFARETG